MGKIFYQTRRDKLINQINSFYKKSNFDLYNLYIYKKELLLTNFLLINLQDLNLLTKDEMFKFINHLMNFLVQLNFLYMINIHNVEFQIYKFEYKLLAKTLSKSIKDIFDNDVFNTIMINLDILN
jgi:hypothetical protein